MIREGLLFCVLVATACGEPEPEIDAGFDGGTPDGATDAGLPDAALSDGGPDAGAGDLGPRYLSRLLTSQDLAGLEGPVGDVKYLAPVVGATPRPPITEPCYFQNMQRYDYHLLFLRSFPGLETLNSSDYANLVLRRPTRIWWGGGLKFYPRTPHPIAGQGVIAWAVYHETAGADRLTAADLEAVQAILSGCIDFAPELLAFLPTDPFQLSFARAERAALATRGIAVILPEELR